MKNTILLLTLIILTLNSNAQTSVEFYRQDGMKETGFRQVIGELKNESDRRDRYNKYGQIVQKSGNYLLKKRTGEWKKYYKSGKLARIGNYLNGEETGEWKNYYENGQLAQISNYIDGKRTGEFKDYYKNKQLSSFGNYIDWKKNGDWKYYYETGKLKERGTYLNGEETGEWEEYYENGQLKETRYYIGNTSNVKQYYENEQISKIEHYQNKLASGEWKYYYATGKIYQTLLWKNGKLMDVLSCFDQNGSNLVKGTLINGNGTVRYYNSDGVLEKETTYINGVEN